MKIILLLIIMISSSWACEIRLPRSLLIIDEGTGQNPEFESKNCPEKIIQDLQKTLYSLEGRVPTQQLASIVTNGSDQTVAISPESISIRHLKSLIREQLPLPSGVQIKDTKAVNMASILVINPGDRIEVHCSPCLYAQEQNINLHILNTDGEKTILSTSVTFARMVRAYRVLSSVPSFSEVSGFDVLKEEYVESIPHTDLISDIDSLRFYKTNKPLRAGELLRKSDLNPVNLVRAGLKTEVVIEGETVRIKTHGISRNNGSHGDLVEVFHPQKNKKYQGKVIDLNKVLVEL